MAAKKKIIKKKKAPSAVIKKQGAQGSLSKNSKKDRNAKLVLAKEQGSLSKSSKKNKNAPSALIKKQGTGTQKSLSKNSKKNKNAKLVLAKEQGSLSKNSKANGNAKLAVAEESSLIKSKQKSIAKKGKGSHKGKKRIKIRNKILKKKILPLQEAFSAAKSWQIMSVFVLDAIFMILGLYLFSLDRTCNPKDTGTANNNNGVDVNDDQVAGNIPETTEFIAIEADDFSLILEDRISDNNFECGIQEIKPNLDKDQYTPVENSWPWMARLRKIDDRYKLGHPVCGATVVSPRHVISAWHCVNIDVSATNYVVTVGEHVEQHGKPDKFRIIKFRKDPFYSESNSYYFGNKSHDILLATLETEIQFSRKVQPACLPPFKRPLAEGRFCWTYYWETGQSRMRVLWQSHVVILEETMCKAHLDYGSGDKLVGKDQEYVKKENAICTQRSPLAWRCTSETGGPLTCEENGKWILYGAGSWGINCELLFLSGVYSTISYSISWICCFMKDISSCQDVSCDLEI